VGGNIWERYSGKGAFVWEIIGEKKENLDSGIYMFFAVWSVENGATLYCELSRSYLFAICPTSDEKGLSTSVAEGTWCQ